MAKKRIGIIGIGEIGTTKHLTQLTKHLDEVEIVALCDIIPERCEKATKILDFLQRFTRITKRCVQRRTLMLYMYVLQIHFIVR